jgi:hypothetical protein
MFGFLLGLLVSGIGMMEVEKFKIISTERQLKGTWIIEDIPLEPMFDEELIYEIASELYKEELKNHIFIEEKEFEM